LFSIIFVDFFGSLSEKRILNIAEKKEKFVCLLDSEQKHYYLFSRKRLANNFFSCERSFANNFAANERLTAAILQLNG